MLSFAFSLTAFAAFLSVGISQTIDPNSVPISDRTAWCNSQIAACPLICLQTPGNSAGTYANTCDPTTLAYSCICSNGQAPNASEYSQTIPYYVCTQYNINCQSNCGGSSSCQAACVQDHPCGAQNPVRVNISTISTTSTSNTVGSAASTASDGPVYTGFGGASAATTTAATGSSGKSAAGTVMNMGQMYGLGVIAAGVLAGASLLL